MQGSYFSKQIIFLVCTMGFFTFRSFADPFWGILMYYGLAVLRPQAIWEWSLPKGIRWSFFAAIVVLVTTILNIPSLKQRTTQRQFLPMLFAFGVCLFFSFFFAKDLALATVVGWEYAKIIIMVFIGSYVIRERWHVRYLGWMIFLCLIYLVYEMNLQYVVDKRLNFYNKGYGGLDNNGAGLMLAMVVPFCYFFFLAERRWWRWGFFLCLIPAFHSVMLTYSRGAMLSTLIVSIGILLTTSRQRLMQTIVVTLLLAGMVLSLAGPDVRKRFLSISKSERDASAQSRLDSWHAGWLIAKDYPWFGVGIRNANLLTKMYGADMEGRTIHNVYIQIAADAGFPAAIIYIGLIGFTLWRLRWSAKRTRNELDDYEGRWLHYICRASMWSLTIFAIGAIFLSFETFELCYLLMLIGAVVPFLAKQGSQNKNELDDALKSGKPVKISTGGLSA
jgi:probable O-glycosylation ligase (exosortase A-associated)